MSDATAAAAARRGRMVDGEGGVRLGGGGGCDGAKCASGLPAPPLRLAGAKVPRRLDIRLGASAFEGAKSGTCAQTRERCCVRSRSTCGGVPAAWTTRREAALLPAMIYSREAYGAKGVVVDCSCTCWGYDPVSTQTECDLWCVKS